MFYAPNSSTPNQIYPVVDTSLPGSNVAIPVKPVNFVQAASLEQSSNTSTQQNQQPSEFCRPQLVSTQELYPRMFDSTGQNRAYNYGISDR